ncbi:phosphatidylserine decarboxylase [Campylobacter sp. faydin G-24]|uniref:Phosphatidylserine decarboxylase n=1 Tax=Campylobacter anatolicus TaxID=2829105 RepID=A0ABS5HH42_9BACT|nr:phosphatidylserine decarboxylase [Campylobacter anatolicus]MBR8463453.1 phosphatidylserine decarboxylase [Campylobacter anatolicus]
MGYVAKSSYKFIAFFAILFIVALLFDIAVIFFAVILVFVIYFFRDPEREPYTDDKLAILVPIDGRVKEISTTKFEDKEFSKVVIEKSFFGVGSLRAPCDMNVSEIRQRHGLFLCNHMKISNAMNERILYVCQNDTNEFMIRIIAGALTRSIYIKNVQSLKASRKFGFLSSGVVVMLLPKDTKICVSVGESVCSAGLLGYFNKRD